MGRWLEKVQLAEPSYAEKPTSVSSVSPAAGTSAQFPEGLTQNAQITPLLYQAADLLPELSLITGHKNDEGYINRILAGRSSRERHRLLSNYKDVWLDAMRQSTAPEYARDNVGRYHANRWLREHIHGDDS